MALLKGISISPGYAEGTAVIYACQLERRLEVLRRGISPCEIQHEHQRLDEAVEKAHQELERSQEPTSPLVHSDDVSALLAVHATLVSEVAQRVQDYVQQEQVNAEQALEAVINDLAARLGRIESGYIRDREQDVRDVGRRMLRHLTGASSWLPETLPIGSIFIAREVLPSEAVDLAKSGVIAIVADQVGKNSHTAILVRSLAIPAVTGIPGVTTLIEPGARLLVDGCAGEVTIHPSRGEVQHFTGLQQGYNRSAISAAAVETLPCVTQDGVSVGLFANIGRPEDVEQVASRHLDGVGLFRTEFLFLESRMPPDFQEQIDIYRQAVEGLGELPLVIRTFDLGGDKTPPFLLPDQAGPHASLALRGLRFSLAERCLFETQLRAIVQAAQGRNVRVLFPMVVGGHDFARACAALASAASDLGVEQKPLLGAMIETPSALFALEEILEVADFLTIGTNDLTQYMLALDRDEAELSDLCTPWHPLVLRAIRQVIEAAAVKNCPVCICGEEAGEPGFACLLVGLGARELSLSPARAANVRQTLRSIRCQDMERAAQKALRCGDSEEVKELFAEFGSLP